MATVGHAYLKVLPSLRGLARSLREEINGAERAAPPVTVHVRVRKHSFASVTKDLGALVTRMAALSLATAGAQAATGALLGLASSISSAAGAAAVLPGALLAGQVAAGTLKLGLDGVSDALSAIAEGDAEKFAASLAKLAPAARETVLAVAGFKPAFDEVKQSVQQSLFTGLGAEVQALGSVYLPMLRAELPLVAQGFNAGARGVAEFARQGQTVADVRTLIDNTARSLSALAPAGASVAQILRDIGVVGSEFLPELAGGFAGAAQSAAAFVARARESGQLAQWMATGLDVVRQLGVLLGNLGSIVASVFRAASASGGGLLAILIELTGQLAAFLRSAEGQQALNTFFASAAELARMLMPLLLEIGKILATTVVPAVVAFARGLLSSGGLHALLTAVGDAFRLLSPAVEPVARALGAVLAAVAPLLPPLAMLASQVLTAIANALMRIDFTPLIDALIRCIQAASELAEPFGRLLGLAAALFSASLPFLADSLVLVADAVSFCAGFLQGLIEVFDGLLAAGRWLADGLGNVANWISERFSELKAWVGRKLDEIGQFFRELPGNILRWLGNAGEWLVGAGRDLIHGLIRGIKDAASWLWGELKRLAGGVVDTVKGWLGIKSPSRVFMGLGRQVGAGFALGIGQSAPLALEAAADMAADVARRARVSVPTTPATRTPATAGGDAERVTIHVHPRAEHSELDVATAVSRQLAFTGRS
ncbi:hypothetical protein NLX83_13720 [Allokutzneria sp. A3M-2-11 16]|uniref:phage tail protein n=1 Tax=Allokutzneria sp. A3M-2-11 16 TaxID=2962043 RepID=UPI0020B888E7|nr:hypothetical protein [Allokutzneria sp. A3M-2-11 16]MCP3800317.1 hypothetical protein [Allokutzneria sp. A3M-2-11 16]